MTLPRLAALNAEWRAHPPAHILLAAWLGHKPPGKRKRVTREGLRQMFGGLLRGG